jgi:hypothetical protein
VDRRAIVRILTAIAALAALAGPLLIAVAPRFMEPMFLGRPPIVDLLLAMSVIGMVVGLIWIHRITNLDEGSDRSIFRYRDQGALGHLTELRDLVPSLWLPIPRLRVPMPIRRRLTARWLVTRLELALGVLSVTVAVALSLLLMPTQRFPMFGGPDWTSLLAIAGTAGCVVGLVWMLRIAGRPAETGPSIWRAHRD